MLPESILQVYRWHRCRPCVHWDPRLESSYLLSTEAGEVAYQFDEKVNWDPDRSSHNGQQDLCPERPRKVANSRTPYDSFVVGAGNEADWSHRALSRLRAYQSVR